MYFAAIFQNDYCLDIHSPDVTSIKVICFAQSLFIEYLGLLVLGVLEKGRARKTRKNGTRVWKEMNGWRDRGFRRYVIAG